MGTRWLRLVAFLLGNHIQISRRTFQTLGNDPCAALLLSLAKSRCNSVANRDVSHGLTKTAPPKDRAQPANSESRTVANFWCSSLATKYSKGITFMPSRMGVMTSTSASEKSACYWGDKSFNWCGELYYI